jgi:hypothetical protein
MSKRFVIAAALFVLAGMGRTAEAAPILGGQLFYTGGTVTVESLPVTSGFTTELGLYDSGLNRLLYIMDDEPAGVTVTFNPSAHGIGVGQELIFGIRIVIPDTNEELFMGPASRNFDNTMHATVDDMGLGVFIVGFEDIPGGGDRDFDDNVFKFTGGVSAVPEPATFALLGLGVLAAARRRMNRSK